MLTSGICRIPRQPSELRGSCLRRTSPPSCSVVQTTCFWYTSMNTGYLSNLSRPPERCHESSRRASWCPGLVNLRWHTTIASSWVLRNLPTTDRMFPSRCRDNHEGAPTDGRHWHGEWGNSASRGNSTPLGLALQKLLLAGLHFQSSEIDRLFDKLNSMLGNAGDDVKARLEKCIECCKQAWMDDTASERKSLIDLLCGIPEDDDRVQENRFHKWWHWTIFSQRHWRCYFVTETMITLV